MDELNENNNLVVVNLVVVGDLAVSAATTSQASVYLPFVSRQMTNGSGW
jgi:hypothetical protein